MDRGAANLLSVSRRPMSAGQCNGMSSSTAVRPTVRHASASSHRRPYAMDSSTRPADELSATKVSLLLHIAYQTGIRCPVMWMHREHQCIQDSIEQVLEVSRSHLQLQGRLYIITTSATSKNYWIWPSSSTRLCLFIHRVDKKVT